MKDYWKENLRYLVILLSVWFLVSYVFGISPEGFGTMVMIANFSISVVVSGMTLAPLQEVQDIVEEIRIPSGVSEPLNH